MEEATQNEGTVVVFFHSAMSFLSCALWEALDDRQRSLTGVQSGKGSLQTARIQ